MNYRLVIFVLVFIILGLLALNFTKSAFHYLDELDSQDQEDLK